MQQVLCSSRHKGNDPDSVRLEGFPQRTRYRPTDQQPYSHLFQLEGPSQRKLARKQPSTIFHDTASQHLDEPYLV